MNADFLAILDFWEKEKGISKDVLLNAVQESLISAAKKAVGPARELRCSIDSKSGDIKAFAKLVVAEKVISKHDQVSLADARKRKADAQIGEELEVEVTPAGFGRIAAQYAKQALLSQVRRAEKALIFDEFKDRVGDIVSGTVRTVDDLRLSPAPSLLRGAAAPRCRGPSCAPAGGDAGATPAS